MRSITNSKLILSAITILAALTMILGATFAFFSDTETSQNNTLIAGSLDLKIDNESFYNGVLNLGTTWLTPKDLEQGDFFYNFTDVKPGDWGEDTISLHVKNNDSWVCTETTITADDDVSCSEPENSDDPTCSEPDSEAFDGDLADELEIMWWADDGDNVLEEGEDVIDIGAIGQGPQNVPVSRPIADSANNIFSSNPNDPLEGGDEGPIHYIAKAWCFGNMTPAGLPQDDYTGPDDPANDLLDSEGPATSEDGGFTCDGTVVNGNAAITDKVMMDVSFSALQSRNNDDFVCSGEPSPSITPTPTPLACQQADVMLVLDRSGSINSGELSDLKIAAKAFVDDLGLTPTGVHGGQSSFSSSATLDHILSSNSVTLEAAIDALASGGLTNLKSGIDTASAELTGINDRADGTSPDKMIIITDGHPNRPLPSSTADDVAAASATAFKAGGGEIFVVGVGSDVNTVYLQGVASPGNYYSASDYSGLQTALQNIDLCE